MAINSKKAIHCTGKLLNPEVEAADKNRHVHCRPVSSLLYDTSWLTDDHCMEADIAKS